MRRALTHSTERRKSLGSWSQFKEQQSGIMRLGSMKVDNKKAQNQQSIELKRRRSSIALPKDPGFNEFSFKNSMDSIPGPEKDSNHSHSSSRQNFENSVSNLSNDLSKKSSFDPSLSFASPGLKRALTPSFTHRPSGFLVEKKGSRWNLGSKTLNQSQFPNSSGSILPQDLKTDRAAGDVTYGGFNPSIDDGSMQIDSPGLKQPSFLHDHRELHSNSKISVGECQSPYLVEQMIVQQPQQLQPSPFGIMPSEQRSDYKVPTFYSGNCETVKEQSIEHEKGASLTMKDPEEEQKEKEGTDAIEYKKQTSKGGSRKSSGSEKTPNADPAFPITILEPFMQKLCDQLSPNPPAGKTLDFKMSTLEVKANSPVKALPLLKIPIESSPSNLERSTGVSIGKTPQAESISFLKSGRSHSASKTELLPLKEVFENDFTRSLQKRRTACCFSPITPLTGREKFKINLLEVIKNEDDIISPISCPQKHSHKTAPPFSFLAGYRSPKKEIGKTERKKSEDSIRGIEAAKIEAIKGRKVPTDESLPVIPSKGSIGSNSETSKLKRESFQKDLGSSFLRRGLEKKKTDLLSLVREESNQPEPQIKANIPKHERTSSVDNSGGLGVSPLGRNTPLNSLRLQLFEFELGQHPASAGNSLSATPVNHPQAHLSQSYLSATPNHLNETNNRSMVNFEDNVSAMNVSNFVFVYENEEVEYDEANEANGTSARYSRTGSRILGGVVNSPTNIKSPSHSPMIKQRAPEWETWKMRKSIASPMNRIESTYSNTNYHPLNMKKESFTSLSSMHASAGQLSESNSSKGGDVIILNQYIIENSEEKESGFSSPAQIKRLGTLQAADNSNRHRTVRTSIFSKQESGVFTDVVKSLQSTETNGGSPGKLTVPEPNQSHKRAKSLSLTPIEDLQETGRTTHPQNEKQMDYAANEFNFLTVPVADNDSSVLQKVKYSRGASDLYSGSVSPILRSPILKRTQTSVVETKVLDKTRDDEGQKKINNYLLVKDLGKGGFGKVKLAQDTITNRYYAIKIANKAKLKRKLIGKSKDALHTLASEIAIMKKLDHPNIVKLWEVIDDPNEDKLYLVMDLVKKGAVMSKGYWRYETRQALNRSGISVFDAGDASMIGDTVKRVLTEEKALKYFRELILGLDYLHNHVGVIHRDIKPENLLVDEFDTLKISDFGVSSLMEDNSDELKNNAGTKLFLPPESFEGKSFRGMPADIWAVGATLYYFMTGKPPFNSATQADLVNKVMNEEPEYPESMNEKIKEVIKGCLRKDPDKRMTLAEIRSSAWITEDGMYKIENIFEGEGAFLPSEQEINAAFTKLKFRAVVKIKAKMKQHLNKTRDMIVRRKSAVLESVGGSEEKGRAKLTMEQDSIDFDKRKTNQKRLNLLSALQ